MTKKGVYSNLSPEDKTKINLEKRLKYNSVSEEEKKHRSEKRREAHKQMLANFTPEQLADYKNKVKEGWIKFDNNLTPDEKELLKQSRYASNRKWWASLSPEQKTDQLDKMRKRRLSLSPEQKQLEKERLAKIKSTPDYIRKMRAYGDEYRQKRKAIVISHYTKDKMCCMNPKCEVSGGSKNIKSLCIDHINGGGRKQVKTLNGYNFYDWLINNNFPEGFQVLCMNCNAIKKVEEKEDRPWNKRSLD